MAKKKGKTKEQVNQADMTVDVDDELENTENIETPTLDEMGVTLRSLTRKQRRELRNSNLDPALIKCPGESEEDDARERFLLTEDMIDWILENVYSDYDFDDVPNQECMKLALDTYTLAMGRIPADRLKN
jgi:hypothetical protein